MKILFVKRSQSFPRSSGHDVHGYFMMRSLQHAGCRLGLLTAADASSEAIEGLDLVWQGTFSGLPEPRVVGSLPKWQEKFRSYWGMDRSWPTKVSELVASEQFDAVVVVGLEVLPYLGLVKGAKRIWYAADEWLLHHWSLVQWTSPATYKDLKLGLVKGLYERAFNDCTDRVWAVSETDRRFFRWVMGARQVDLVPNGVDADYYSPRKVVQKPESLAFWGRLDFEPNIDAIRWFGEKVWKGLKSERPNATWTVYGFGAGDVIRRFQHAFGFELVSDLPDLRDAGSSHQVAILPFVSGAGIKNKLLEGAAMSLPIVASEKALTGLDRNKVPFLIAKDPKEWRDHIKGLWDDADRRQVYGDQVRNWVLENHSWDSAAAIALEGLRGR
jgi:glycosyltransferase involved in cell wall biosynthesis